MHRPSFCQALTFRKKCQKPLIPLNLHRKTTPCTKTKTSDFRKLRQNIQKPPRFEPRSHHLFKSRPGEVGLALRMAMLTIEDVPWGCVAPGVTSSDISLTLVEPDMQREWFRLGIPKTHVFFKGFYVVVEWCLWFF